MVIGNGLVAKAFASYIHNDDVVIFASGVSNSSANSAEAFSRELALLSSNISQYPQQLFVYFSTCSIYDPALADSSYVQHKKQMEQYILEHHPRPLIFRISNLAGKTNNAHTILNYLHDCIQNETPFLLWKGSERNIIDVEDAFNLCDRIIQEVSDTNQYIFDIANIGNYSVEQIVQALESTVHKKGNYTIVEKESRPLIPMTGMKRYPNELNRIFTADYLNKVVQKYYAQP